MRDSVAAALCRECPFLKSFLIRKLSRRTLGQSFRLVSQQTSFGRSSL